MSNSNIDSSKSPCCTRTNVNEKAVCTNEYYGYYGSSDIVSPSRGGGGDGFVGRTQDRRGCVTKYSFQTQEASLTVAVEALALNSAAHSDQELSTAITTSSSSTHATMSADLEVFSPGDM